MLYVVVDMFALNFFRYALSKGATSFAIDIEEAAHDGGGCKSPVSSIKVLQRPTLRRNEATLLEEEPSGASLVKPETLNHLCKRSREFFLSIGVFFSPSFLFFSFPNFPCQLLVIELYAYSNHGQHPITIGLYYTIGIFLLSILDG